MTKNARHVSVEATEEVIRILNLDFGWLGLWTASGTSIHLFEKSLLILLIMTSISISIFDFLNTVAPSVDQQLLFRGLWQKSKN